MRRKVFVVLAMLIAMAAAAQVTITGSVDRFTVTVAVDTPDAATDYYWDFDGDRRSDATGVSVSHTYAAELPLDRVVDVYTIAAGGEMRQPMTGQPDGTANVTLDATPQPASVEISASTVTVGDTLAFRVRQDPVIPINSGSVDWGDGSTPDTGGLVQTHTYTEPGAYTIKASIGNALGGTRDLITPITVTPFDDLAVVRNMAQADPAGLIKRIVQITRQYDAANPDTPRGVWVAIKKALSNQEKTNVINDEAVPVVDRLVERGHLTADQKTRIEAILQE